MTKPKFRSQSDTLCRNPVRTFDKAQTVESSCHTEDPDLKIVIIEALKGTLFTEPIIETIVKDLEDKSKLEILTESFTEETRLESSPTRSAIESLTGPEYQPPKNQPESIKRLKRKRRESNPDIWNKNIQKQRRMEGKVTKDLRKKKESGSLERTDRKDYLHHVLVQRNVRKTKSVRKFRMKIGVKYCLVSGKSWIGKNVNCMNDCAATGETPASSGILKAVFNEKIIGLFNPKKDQCDLCCGYEVDNISQQDYEHHQAHKEAASEKSEDKARCQ
ncbi:hypothetical protein LOTGIDRAFT_155181 [Lottia gigantea]|uniref:Uncharacterized protein n=1 Tax=Lottia gigantea TaxID=225164 RepID=V3ZSZ1_LOTGI|nr:hypothetical protein LOTGIDRAFT_155181 [Lottia gigantea]ESO85690.1 hypothetical protein LOTGIDRAFT_155181 [Lottia gigantea]